MPSDRSQPLTRPAEAALIERACRGCCDSFGTLVRAYQDRLYNFLLRRLRDPHRAEEAAQAAFVRAWEKLEQFDPAWRFSTWLYTIAIRLAADADRRDRAAVSFVEPAMAGRGAGEGVWGAGGDRRQNDPSAEAVRRDEWRNVWQLAGRVLDADDRTALWLRYGEEASIDQIARVLGRTNGAVRVLLHRARKRLAEAYRSRDGARDDWTENDETPATVNSV
jgi:RNA polymerase sigma-70 factor, ECF subfamily